VNRSIDSNQSTSESDAATGLPLLRSWRAVYWFVLAVFVVWVALLAALSRVFS
jgi:hypothetical protein